MRVQKLLMAISAAALLVAIGALVVGRIADGRCRDRAERADAHTLCRGEVRADDMFGDACRCVGDAR